MSSNDVLFEFGPLLTRYPKTSAGEVGLVLVPSSRIGDLVEKRSHLSGFPYIDSILDIGNPPAGLMDSLAHVKLSGQPYPGPFTQGQSMRGAPTGFVFDEQQIEEGAGGVLVITRLKNSGGTVIEHTLHWNSGEAAVSVQTSLHNGSSDPVGVEMLTSFSLGGITPFHAADAPHRLVAHRFRSYWSAEGRLVSESIEDLHLERSWLSAGVNSERFGQVGSLPVRGWFPFVAIEDTEAKVVWAAQLAWAGSWQLEISRSHDDLCISGGLADREFGHWMKVVQPGETLHAPMAYLTCVSGSLDDACDALTEMQQRAADRAPEIERDLPIIFNEWCTTWGDPSHEKLTAIADCIKDLGIRYLVIDAGWYRSVGAWHQEQGDWIPCPTLFPDGLAATAAAIRERGLLPGLWFEMEVVGSEAAAFERTDHLLQRDGSPITSNNRRFWDLNDPWVRDYLSKRVIGLLRDCKFEYLKVDYNDTIGIGSDHPDSLGEGLRRQTEGTYWLFDEIRSALPHLVIENCSSGGHRLEPSMLGRTSMSSFSDAHELPEIPIIAAALHRLALPRQLQIWAVLHPEDSQRRLVFSLAATFLGRMCLSGGITGLDRTQRDILQQAIALYKRAVPVIKRGSSRLFGETGKSWRHPSGAQVVRRIGSDAKQILLVCHSFARSSATVEVPLPDGIWKVQASLTSGDIVLEKEDGGWDFGIKEEFAGGVWLLTRE